MTLSEGGLHYFDHEIKILLGPTCESDAAKCETNDTEHTEASLSPSPFDRVSPSDLPTSISISRPKTIITTTKHTPFAKDLQLRQLTTSELEPLPVVHLDIDGLQFIFSRPNEVIR